MVRCGRIFQLFNYLLSGESAAGYSAGMIFTVPVLFDSHEVNHFRSIPFDSNRLILMGLSTPIHISILLY